MASTDLDEFVFSGADLTATQTLDRAIAIEGVDFVMLNAKAPEEVSAYESFPVSWTIKNQGNYTRASIDAIYLSEDNQLDDSDFPVGDYSHLSFPIQAGSIASFTTDISLSYRSSSGFELGQFGYLIFVANSSEGLYPETSEPKELDRSNNIQVVPVRFKSADLVVTNVSAPTRVGGDVFNVSWTVTNQGDASSFSEYWQDSIFLDTGIPGSEDILLAQEGAGRPLESGQSYTINTRVLLPKGSDLPSTASLKVITNWRTDAYQYSYRFVETSYGNNTGATTIQIDPVATWGQPDLAISNIAGVPATVSVLDRFQVSVTTKNQGTAGISGSWSDAIYLSSDAQFDASDQRLFSRPGVEFVHFRPVFNTILLAAGESYQYTASLLLPTEATGQQYLLFRTNVEDGIDEPIENNLAVVPIFVKPVNNILGTAGNDTLTGTDLDDWMTGLAGRDTLRGGIGDDVLIGGFGSDTLTGGLGRDRFVFTNLDERSDRITDFEVGTDVLDVREIFANALGGVITITDPIKEGYVELVANGASTNVRIDLDGFREYQSFKTLVTIENVSPMTFMRSNYLLF